METQEIYNFSIHELVTTDFSVDWSGDNQISLITAQGIHIFEMQPNPLCATATAKFKRSFIYPTDILPTEPFISVTDSILNSFGREDMYSAMLDEGLTPKLAEKDDIIPTIAAVAWSPKKLFKPSKCVLGILTSSGAVDLTIKSGMNWHSVCNLSGSWWDIVKNELDFNPQNINVKSLDAKTFRNNLRRLQATAITWSELYQSNGCEIFSYFVTAYRSCDLVIWKIERLSEFLTEIKPLLINRTRFDIDAKITTLLWIQLDMEKYLILIGFLDGQVHCLDENVSKKSITDIVDKIPVSFMKELSRTDNEINVVILKSFFLIIMTLNYDGKLLRQKHIQLPAFSITGIQLINGNSIIVTTQDAKLYIIKLKEECDKLSCERINCDIKTSKVHFLGLACAPSGVTFINITVPDGLYDHLINREPTVIQMFGFKGEMWDPWNKLNKNDRSIHWDCLESIRMRAAKEADSENHLPSIPEKLDTLSIHQLRNVMWLSLISENLKQKKVIKNIDDIGAEISEAQPLIFVHTASSYMIRLSKKETLTDDMRLCIHFLRLYLEVFLAGEDDDDDDNGNNAAVERAKYALNETENLDLIHIERCNLCSKPVTELPWDTASCPDGHQLPRCALTLLQITCLKFRRCPVCARIFHPILDEDYEDVKCLYCDVSTMYDNRVIGINDELEEKCKNLSIRPTWEMQGSKSQESETSAVNEKRNKKRRTTMTDTFTLVVNKDDETITETWQEL